MSINLKTLISKLDDTCRQAAERAANLCMARGNYEVDLEHLFLALLEQPQSDFVLIARRSGILPESLERDLNDEISQFKTGNSRTPVFSQHIPKLFEHAWLIASLDSETTRIRSGHLLLALLTEPDLAQLAYRGSKLFVRFKRDELKHDFAKLTEGSQEAVQTVRFADASAGGEAGEGDDAAPAEAKGGLSKTPALDQFTTNLTQRAREGKIDPVIGRDGEIRQVIDILMRRRQNNPILTGEAGVGKTAVVEGLARRIADKDVPDVLQGVELHTLDMGLLQAGASVKGEFENRLKNVIDEVKKSPHPIILFIDEAHTMIGAGGTAGQNDAANLLKPALARGELRTIAATTWSEYKKYFEKDAALARRFQVVKVEEPSEALAAAMLRGMVGLMESHFNIRVLDEAVTEAVRLSHRYISGRQLPDKAVSVLDTACAKVALGQSATPAIIEDTRKHLDRLQAEIGALQRETAGGSDQHGERLAELHAQQAEAQAVLASNEERLGRERDLAGRIAALRQQMEQGEAASGEAEPASDEGDGDVAVAKPAAKRGKAKPELSPQHAELARLQAELRELQGETPMVPLQVDGTVVAEIVSAWTGVPLGRMVKDEIRTVRTLGNLLVERVIGQDHALDAIAQRVRTATAKLEDPNKPRGVFMFVGPSGVGKTETALALADILYGGERKLVTINMSEYQEAHSVSGLKGSPPGYVGYGEGGVLTEAVRRNPYSVVLLDEVEKAHPDVLEMFFQVFDKGMMDDAEGREIDFRNTLIILTSNIGSSQIMQACLNKPAEEIPGAEALSDALRPVLMRTFKPAFLGRLKVVPYYPINDDVLAQIITLKLGRIRDRVIANHKATFSWDDSLVEAVLARCTEVDSGARNVDHILNGTLLPEIAESVLAAMAEGNRINAIKVTAGKKGDFKYKVS
ncbi:MULTISPECIES: type VI secretion system ATPase TssH [Stenotrophomonas]|jgi:type VI secretion system protein VasG|uniref:type VI secretion system ATPase TssH n=1 Tax=Stenotrophomonas TaxID=40323 RepID=UPI0015DFBF40|nr:MULTISPECIES: type VI secretion system ATPase TssH [Stenotrophomonas]ELF4098713.1 type VI secretion system ATPase TssH [Stenotrophomonas maltophilia]MBA0430387.1 type VI secretion system ATPase TssH [Stenotrophomonas maltophilia]MDH0275714.1 type VI secretion system ATPase TssH [Stenotrophomonas sp. GD04089]MDH1913536.1 type VI secretion system ATPase TssH [Stenotrophomonas sp. GD03794]UQA68840.1 type VI secretion system ATPase TssH [Stenotrophomonas maltophilia]